MSQMSGLLSQRRLVDKPSYLANTAELIETRSRAGSNVNVERQVLVHVHAEVPRAVTDAGSVRAILKCQLLVCFSKLGDLLSSANPQDFWLVCI